MSDTLPSNLANAVAGQYILNIRNIFREAWHKVKGAKKPFWGASALVVLILLPVFIGVKILEFIVLTYGASQWENGVNFIGSFIISVVNFPLNASLFFLMIRHVAGRPIRATMVLMPLPLFMKLAAILIIMWLVMGCTGLVFGLAIGFSSFLNSYLGTSLQILPLILLIVLLICFSIVFNMSSLLVLDKQLKIKLAIKIAFKAIFRRIFKNLWLWTTIVLFCFLLITVLALIQALGIHLVWFLLTHSTVITKQLQALDILGFIVTLGICSIWILPMIFNLYAIWYRQIFGIELVAQG